MTNSDIKQKLVSATDNETFILKLQKLPALSEEFADKMSSLSQLGKESFRDVEVQFIETYPKAVQEDQMLTNLKGLTGEELAAAIDARLHQIFHARPENMSEQARTFLKDVYYYFITIQDEESHQVRGFATFMGGGSLSNSEFKMTVLAVDKSFRKRGLAKHLVSALKYFDIPFNKLLVTTRPSNTPAINLYKNLGFIEDMTTENSNPSHFVRGHWTHLMHTPTTPV